MRIKLLITGLIVCSISIFCQESYDPKVVILSPRIIIKEPDISKDISFFDDYMISYQKKLYIEKKDSLIDSFWENDTLKANKKVHLKNIIEFAPYWNFNTHIVQRYVNSLQSILSTTFANNLVIAESEKSISGRNLIKEYAEKNSIDYVVSIDTLFVSKDRKGLYVKPILSMYDKKANQHIDLHSNLKRQFNIQYVTIKKKHLIYTKKTTKYLFYDDIESYSKLVNYIQDNGDFTKRKEINDSKELEQKRLNKLDSLFKVSKKFDIDFLQNKDSILKTPTSAITTIISSKNKDRAIAYFARKEELNYKELSGIHDVISIIYCNKQNQKIEHKYLIFRSMSFKEISMEEKVKEEFMKLVDMNFFKENSCELNDEFWEKELFKKHYIKN